MSLINYRAKVLRDHQSFLVWWYFFTYSFFWYHTEIWLKPEDRRPYTYIMRDLFFPHMAWFYAVSGSIFAGLFAIIFAVHWNYASIFIFFLALLWAHLRWGSKWIPDEH